MPDDWHMDAVDTGKPSTPTHYEGDWRSGQMTPPTAVGYQTIDQLSPILQEKAFPFPDSPKSPSKAKLRRVSILDWIILCCIRLLK